MYATYPVLTTSLAEMKLEGGILIVESQDSCSVTEYVRVAGAPLTGPGSSGTRSNQPRETSSSSKPYTFSCTTVRILVCPGPALLHVHHSSLHRLDPFQQSMIFIDMSFEFEFAPG